MATVIRLRRMGRNNRPLYRIVVTDERSPRDGRFIETLGHYDPIAKEMGKVDIKKDRVEYWLTQGVRVTDTVRSILKRQAIKL